MTGLLPKIKVSDVPENRAKRVKGLAIVGKVETREVSNGYLQVAVPLLFSEEATEEVLASLVPAAVDAVENGNFEQFTRDNNLRILTARWNVRPEWFDGGYTDLIRSGQVSDNERIQYNINMSGLTRGLSKSAGLDEVDFEALTGRVVGFTTRNRKDNPSRLDIGGFYTPRKKK